MSQSVEHDKLYPLTLFLSQLPGVKALAAKRAIEDAVATALAQQELVCKVGDQEFPASARTELFAGTNREVPCLTSQGATIVIRLFCGKALPMTTKRPGVVPAFAKDFARGRGQLSLFS